MGGIKEVKLETKQQREGSKAENKQKGKTGVHGRTEGRLKRRQKVRRRLLCSHRCLIIIDIAVRRRRL